jgi:two-component sensor histidine kinase
MNSSTTVSPRFTALKSTFHNYANWLIRISWKKFIVLSFLFMMAAGLLQSLPPFTWRYSEKIQTPPSSKSIKVPELHKPKVEIQQPIENSRSGEQPPSESSTSSHAAQLLITVGDIQISLPREAVSNPDKLAQILEDKLSEWEDAQVTLHAQDHFKEHEISWGDFLPGLAFLLILVSMVIKITYNNQIQAEHKADEATQSAMAEQLKRQLVEARMAAMQAQVEPHFLFNTLASIDHLIETDPPRASQMQKSLIALLRATLPAMRDHSGNNLRSLGQELAVIQPYLEIQKMRMEDRLQTSIDVPEGLKSAVMPSMMIQSLVENAIQHGLEPMPQGGQLRVSAQVADGRLVIQVQDTGMGFGQAVTQGTGFGLNNIRERLTMLYGDQATLALTPRPSKDGTGTTATLSLPYRTAAAAAA